MWKSAVRSRLSRSAQSTAPAAGSVAIISRTRSTPPGSETSSQTLCPEYSAYPRGPISSSASRQCSGLAPRRESAGSWMARRHHVSFRAMNPGRDGSTVSYTLASAGSAASGSVIRNRIDPSPAAVAVSAPSPRCRVKSVCHIERPYPYRG
jgi:hypothetical protein